MRTKRYIRKSKIFINGIIGGLKEADKISCDEALENCETISEYFGEYGKTFEELVNEVAEATSYIGEMLRKNED